jgi:hypothetical protein
MTWMSGILRMEVVTKIESLSLDFKIRFKNKSYESFSQVVIHILVCEVRVLFVRDAYV